MALDGAVIFDGEISPAFPVEHAGGVEAADGGDVSVTRVTQLNQNTDNTLHY
jgi:hypothetical protein